MEGKDTAVILMLIFVLIISVFSFNRIKKLSKTAEADKPATDPKPCGCAQGNNLSDFNLLIQ